ncbi:unnamed protein product [Amaranthus hypochondriacus]
MQGVSTIDELKELLSKKDSIPVPVSVEEQNNEDQSATPAASVQLTSIATAPMQPDTDGEQAEDNDEGWTPVAPSKIARRGCQKSTIINKEQVGAAVVDTVLNRDGNPQIPSP